MGNRGWRARGLVYIPNRDTHARHLFLWSFFANDIYIYKTVVCVCLFATYRPHVFPGAAPRDRRQSDVRAGQSRLTLAPRRVELQRSVDARWSWEARWAHRSGPSPSQRSDRLPVQNLGHPCFCRSFGNDGEPSLKVLLSRRKIVLLSPLLPRLFKSRTWMVKLLSVARSHPVVCCGVPFFIFIFIFIFITPYIWRDASVRALVGKDVWCEVLPTY